MPKKIILRSFLSPGDIVMLTAAVKSIHASYPNEFLIDIRTSCKELWEYNPLLTSLDEAEKDVEIIECEYPLINSSNDSPYHFIHGYIQDLNHKLNINIQPVAFKGDIYISDQEKTWISQVEEIVGMGTPFWILDAGGKFDFTAKWWDYRRFQEVIDYFQGKILFVQIGQESHYHPNLNGVLNLVGKTDLRQLIRLHYHSQGVLTPVSFPMHLAAAVECKNGLKNRPCVVVAGGREPSQWEAYPHHQYIHMNGALSCCDNGGCWKSRVVPLGDGDCKDNLEQLCENVVGGIAKCMDLIEPVDVIRRIELYFKGGVVQYLSSKQAKTIRSLVTKQKAYGVEY
ncbi:MAG: ADP-heptose--LPS heptosyltransferase [Planctomycetes bacterium]|nr:ADP-heptose--LPS heptosyltransferase [Planctomycetota bacterium]